VNCSQPGRGFNPNDLVLCCAVRALKLCRRIHNQRMGSGPLKRNLILANFTDPNSPSLTRDPTDHSGGKRREGICGKWGIVKRRSSLFQIRDARRQSVESVWPRTGGSGDGDVRGHWRDQRDHIAGRTTVPNIPALRRVTGARQLWQRVRRNPVRMASHTSRLGRGVSCQSSSAC